MQNKAIFLLLILFSVLNSFGQNEGRLRVNKSDTTAVKTIDRKIDPLAPSRAAFYSALIPGLGQAYNKKYWKIPIVYGLMGGGIYFYIKNNNQYNRYRDAYKIRLAGGTNDEFPELSDESLIEAQRFYSRNKNISILFTVGAYILNIIDANVDAHLMQFNVDKNLSFKPKIDYNVLDNKTNVGLSLNYNF